MICAISPSGLDTERVSARDVDTFARETVTHGRSERAPSREILRRLLFPERRLSVFPMIFAETLELFEIRSIRVPVFGGFPVQDVSQERSVAFRAWYRIFARRDCDTRSLSVTFGYHPSIINDASGRVSSVSLRWIAPPGRTSKILSLRYGLSRSVVTARLCPDPGVVL